MACAMGPTCRFSASGTFHKTPTFTLGCECGMRSFPFRFRLWGRGSNASRSGRGVGHVGIVVTILFHICPGGTDYSCSPVIYRRYRAPDHTGSTGGGSPVIVLTKICGVKGPDLDTCPCSSTRELGLRVGRGGLLSGCRQGSFRK